MNILLISERKNIAEAFTDILELEQVQEKDGYIEGQSKWDGNRYKLTWMAYDLIMLSNPVRYGAEYETFTWEKLPFLPVKYKYDVDRKKAQTYKVLHDLIKEEWNQHIIYVVDTADSGFYQMALLRMIMSKEISAIERVMWVKSYDKQKIREEMSQVEAYHAYNKKQEAVFMRAIADYMVRVNYSNMLSIRSKKDVEIDRPMAVALSMIADRQNEIISYVKKTYYSVFANCSNGKYEFSAEWEITEDSAYYDTKAPVYENKGFLLLGEAQSFAYKLNKCKELVVERIIEETEKKKAPLLYNLSDLITDCGQECKLKADQTVSIAFSLYEKGFITYPYTDAVCLSRAAAERTEQILTGLKGGHNKAFVKQILDFSLYEDIGNSQYTDEQINGFHAIIPTGFNETSLLTKEETKVFQMIIDRYLCIFLPQAEYETSAAIFKSENGETFRLDERNLTKQGWISALKGTRKRKLDAKGTVLSRYMKAGDIYEAQFFTEKVIEPKPREYTQQTLICDMTEVIGAPEKRNAVIQEMLARGYIAVDEKKQEYLSLTEKGEFIFTLLQDMAPELLSKKAAASWEKGLRKIEIETTTRAEYTKKLEKSIQKTYQRLDKIVQSEREARKYEPFIAKDTGLKCPYCQKPILTARKGFRCKDFKVGDDGCSFYIGTICSVPITQQILTELLTQEHTHILPFQSKKGMMFQAALRLNREEKEIEFVMKNDIVSHELMQV